MGRDENYLLGELVNNYHSGIKSRKWWEFLNEIYGNRIQRMFENGNLLEQFIELVTLRFRSYVSSIKYAKLLYICIEAWLGIFTANKFQYFVLTEVASSDTIMIILENIYIEIAKRWYINSTIKKEKT